MAWNMLLIKVMLINSLFFEIIEDLQNTLSGSCCEPNHSPLRDNESSSELLLVIRVSSEAKPRLVMGCFCFLILLSNFPPLADQSSIAMVDKLALPATQILSNI